MCSWKNTGDNEKYTFRTWLVKAGFNPEMRFKTSRKFLLRKSGGNSPAWRKNAEAARSERNECGESCCSGETEITPLVKNEIG